MNSFKIDEKHEIKLNNETGLWDTYVFGKLLPRNAEKLFKYYCLNLYNIEAFLNHYFYLSNPSNFNDPFDCNINLIEDVEGLEKLETVKRNNIRNIGIASFSETIDNHLMWAHYTNNYNGFALEFKGDQIDVKMNRDDIKRHSLTRVIYPENPPKIVKNYPFAQHYILTTKFKHWEYEKEWRIIAELQSEDRNLIYFAESVKGIYIGHNIPDNNKSAYRLLLEIQEIKFPEVPVYVVYPHPTDLKLMFERVWN